MMFFSWIWEVRGIKVDDCLGTLRLLEHQQVLDHH
jgi:hypothetical protein